MRLDCVTQGKETLRAAWYAALTILDYARFVFCRDKL